MINWLLSYIVNNEKLAFFHKNARTSKFCDRFVRLLHCVSGQSVLSLLQLRNFPPGLINLSTDAFKGTSYKVNATCSQMTAPLELEWSMKGPQRAWYIRRDVGQGLCMLELFCCRCYGAPLFRGQIFGSARSCLFMSFLYFCTEGLPSSFCRGVINMSAEWCKRLYFC